MPRSKDTKVWNEDLYAGLMARADQARAQGKVSQYTWRDGALLIRSVRTDIYMFSNGRIVGLPTCNKLSKTVDNEIRSIMQGTRPLFPEGWVATNRHQKALVNNDGIAVRDYKKDPYLKVIKMRGGAYAILLAFHYSDVDTMTKDQICEAAQEFCDEAMDANYMAGRPRGAFSAKNTLVKHLLVQENRSQQKGGCWTYTITEHGKQFTKAMMDKFQLSDDGLGQASPLSIDLKPATEPCGFDNKNTSHNPYIKNPYMKNKQQRGMQRMVTTPSPNKGRSRTTKLQQNDRQKLLDWLETAVKEEQMKFNVGESRRAGLHDLCGVIMRAIPGLRLKHQSEGTGSDRALYITVLERDNSIFGIQGLISTAVTSSGSSSSPASVSENKVFAKSIKNVCGNKKIDGGSPAKKVKRAFYACDSDTDDDDELDLDVRPQISRGKVSNKPLAKRVLKFLDSDSDSDSDLEMMLSIAKKKCTTKLETATVNKTAVSSLDVSVNGECDSKRKNLKPTGNQLRNVPPKKMIVVDLLSDSDSDDDLHLEPVEFRKSQKKPTAKLGQTVCLDDSQDSISCFKIEDNGYGPSSCANTSKLVIVIDSRERDSNATPRQLRMELTRILTSGLLNRVWPKCMPNLVVEKTLVHGDFAFELEKNPAAHQRISLSIERKRVGDIVQRSAKGDHWHQLQRMCHRFEFAVLLLEGDASTANQYAANDAQQMDDGWNADSFLIDDDKSIFRFMGRAILSSPKIRFIQTKDEQASLRAVGAFGLMAASSTLASEQNALSPVSRVDYNALSDRLLSGGIPCVLTKRIASEIGSCSRMDEIFEEACDCARDTLLCPIIAHSLPLSDLPDSTTNAAGWAKAIRRVWFSSVADPQAVRAFFEEHMRNVDDPGRLLGFLHSGFSFDSALKMAQNSAGSIDLPARSVLVELSSELQHCFPAAPGEQSFYKVKASFTGNPLSFRVPTIVLTTQAGEFRSSRLCLHVLEGPVVVEAVKQAMSKQSSSDFVSAAWAAALDIHSQCSTSTLRHDTDRRVLLVRGLGPAIEREAKQAGYRQELLVVVDMALAAVSIRHSMVVIQAVKKKQEDLETVAQNLAMACFHYQLLTQKI